MLCDHLEGWDRKGGREYGREGGKEGKRNERKLIGTAIYGLYENIWV